MIYVVDIKQIIYTWAVKVGLQSVMTMYCKTMAEMSLAGRMWKQIQYKCIQIHKQMTSDSWKKQ